MRVAAVTALAVAAVAAVLVVRGGGGHTLVVEADRAPGVIPGLAVRAAGQRVGRVASASITRDHRARLVLRIDDDRAWPVPVDSRLQLRVGGAIKFTDRYVDLRRGRSARVVGEGGRVRHFVAPTDVDELLFAFDRDTRAGLRDLLRNGGATFGDADLQGALKAAPPAAASARAVVDDLGGDPGTLASLVRSADRVTAAVARSRPGVDELLSGAATTFTAVAREAGGVRAAIGEAPATLDAVRGTLGRADTTLRAASGLTARLAPGVTEVRRLAPGLRGTLARLVQVGPDARRTVRTLGGAAPDLDALLDTARPLLPRLRAIGIQGEDALGCIRPYAPEIAGLFTTWGTGIWANTDGKDHYVRAEVGTYPFPNALPGGSAQLTSTFPGLSVSFPRPPGQIAGQPWYQPQCDIGPESGDPAHDPETGAKAMYPPDFFAGRENPDPEAGA